MNQSDIDWTEKVRRFPLGIILLFNGMVCLIIFSQIFLYYEAYISSAETIPKSADLFDVQTLYVEAIKKILSSFALWSFVLLSVNFGIFVFIRKTKMLVIKMEGLLKKCA